jgi:DME family drug/metabolite transporter
MRLFYQSGRLLVMTPVMENKSAEQIRATKARLTMALAAVLWSTSAIFAKSLDLPGPVMAFYRAVFASIFLGLLLPRHHKPTQWRLSLLGMMLCFAVMNLSFVSAMTLTTAANAIFLQYTAPVWMILACRYWLKETVDRASVISVGVGLVGVAIIVGSEAPRDAAGVSLALLAGVSFGFLAVFLRRLNGIHPWWLTFFNHAFAAILLVPVLWALGELPKVVEVSGPQMAGLAAFGIFQMAVPYVLFSHSLKSISPQEAGILGLIEPLLNPILAFLWVRERPSVGTVLGGTVILGAVLLRYLPKTKSARP